MIGRVLSHSIVCLTTALTVCGCGISEHVPSGSVSGSLTIDGKEVTQGQVIFSSVSEGIAVSGNLEPDGSFEITSEVPIGDYKVYITPPTLGDAPPSEDGNPELKQALKEIPQKYLSDSTSDHIVTIATGTNQLEIDLVP